MVTKPQLFTSLTELSHNDSAWLHSSSRLLCDFTGKGQFFLVDATTKPRIHGLKMTKLSDYIVENIEFEWAKFQNTKTTLHTKTTLQVLIDKK